jgi:glucose/arabinose dehydrogenase
VRSTKLVALAVTAATITFAPSAEAATYLSGFEEQTIASGLTRPMTVAWAPDGRMFVAEKDGVLKVIPAGGGPAAVVINLASQVNSASDRGLLGVAVDSQFSQNPYVYLLYTYDLSPLTPDSDSPMVSQLQRLRLNSANQVTEQQILLGSYTSGTCPQASNTLDCIPSDGLSHSIGTVRSAPDGTLWVGSGDAAGWSTVDELAFRTFDEASMAGKLMHIDREGRGLPGHPFCPGDTNLSHVCTKLHAKGFRNPFRFALRPGGGITLGDVGWNTREEVNLIDEGGHSYGWPCFEGSLQTPGYKDTSQCAAQYQNPHVGPVHEYTHDGSRSILGGPTYTGTEYPSGYGNSIFFADYSGGFIKRLEPNESGGFTSRNFVSDWTGTAIEEGPDHNLTYVTVGNFGNGQGSVKRIVYTQGNRAPVPVIEASPIAGTAPLTVSFDGTGSRDPDGDTFTYSWNFGDGATSSAAAPSHTYSAAGTYTARLTLTDNRGKSASATETITAGNSPPVISVSGDRTYRGGEIFSLNASASDAEDGTLGAAAFEWNVRVLHMQHVHPVGIYPGVKTIDVEANSDHDADSHYEVVVTATDSGGATDEETVAVYPETTTVRLRSAPSGAPVSYGGVQYTTPRDLTTTIGFRTTLSAPLSFEQNGQLFNFSSWSDGGSRVHDLSVPAGGATLTATFSGLAGQAPGGSSPGLPPGGGDTGSGPPGDTAGPTLRVTAVNVRRGRLRGSALDASGVRVVRVALRGRRAQAGCRWWVPARARMSVGRRSCERPRWLTAKLTATPGGARWLARLGAPLPVGRYRLLVRSVDELGNRSELDSGPSTRIRRAP